MSAAVAAQDTTVETLAVHSLAWLVVANAVGLLMSVLLLAPAIGDVVAPLTYGRWAAVHLDVALYGWCALPLVGLLLRLYDDGEPSRLGAVAVHLWSGTLLAGAVAWLAGQTSGKLFLDWTGTSRVLFVANLVVLAVVLLVRFVRGVVHGVGHAWLTVRERMLVAAKALLWLGLLAVPVIIAKVTDPDTYPAIDPTTGGPTGASLVLSTIPVLAILIVTPWLLGLPATPSSIGRSHAAVGALALYTIASLGLDRGDHTHREALEIAAMASLLVWAWVLPRHLARFGWPPHARRWLTALLAWGGVLLSTSVVTFLPGVLDRVKFTNVLVAHAHLAMAGMATSFAALVLVALADARGVTLLDRPLPFALWQGGCVVHVAALVAAGALEIASPGVVFHPDARITGLYAARCAGGVLMLAASLAWLDRALRTTWI